MEGPWRNALASLNPEGWDQMIDVWNQLVHIDVEKDHGLANYDPNIVNNFLSYNKYRSEFFGNVKGKTISRGAITPIMGKDEIFNAVMSIPYAELMNMPVTHAGQVSVRITNETYDFRVFQVAYTQPEADAQAQEIDDFIGHSFAAFVDTSNKLGNLIASDRLRIKNIHTRAVENDPASKTNKITGAAKIDGEEYKRRYLTKFYLENEPGTSGRTYPPFSYTNNPSFQKTVINKR